MPVILPEPQESATSSVTVLLVDDEESDLSHWSHILRNLGRNYTVVTARDSESGLAVCRRRTIDCVLLDLDMPESGFNVLLELVPDPKQPSIAVVILTRLAYSTLREVVMNCGAQDWLVKHLTSPEQLDTAIQRAVASIKSGKCDP
jgi:CheY-like chemotaxis protein